MWPFSLFCKRPKSGLHVDVNAETVEFKLSESKLTMDQALDKLKDSLNGKSPTLIQHDLSSGLAKERRELSSEDLITIQQLSLELSSRAGDRKITKLAWDQKDEWLIATVEEKRVAKLHAQQVSIFPRKTKTVEETLSLKTFDVFIPRILAKALFESVLNKKLEDIAHVPVVKTLGLG